MQKKKKEREREEKKKKREKRKIINQFYKYKHYKLECTWTAKTQKVGDQSLSCHMNFSWTWLQNTSSFKLSHHIKILKGKKRNVVCLISPLETHKHRNTQTHVHTHRGNYIPSSKVIGSMNLRFMT